MAVTPGVRLSPDQSRRLDWPGERRTSGVSPDYDNPTRTHAEKGQAERSGQAGRRGQGGVQGSPRLRQPTSHARRRRPSGQAELPTTTQHSTPTRKRKPCAAARPSAAEKGGSGVSLDYDTTQHAHARKKAKRSGQAERSGEGGSGVSPDYDNPTRTHSEEDQVERNGKGEFGAFPNCYSATRPCAKETKRGDHAERSGKRAPLSINSNQRAAKARTNAERPTACKTKRRYICFDFSLDQGAYTSAGSWWWWWCLLQVGNRSKQENPLRCQV
jgi:hypothetical protein